MQDFPLLQNISCCYHQHNLFRYLLNYCRGFISEIFPFNELIPLANMISVLLFFFSELPVFVKEIKVQGVQAVEKKREKRSKRDPRKRDDHCYVLQVINDKSCRYRVLLKKKVQQIINNYLDTSSVQISAEM